MKRFFITFVVLSLLASLLYVANSPARQKEVAGYLNAPIDWFQGPQESRPWWQNLPREPLPPPRLVRPYGMAPVAFEAYKRACSTAGIHPYRIGQTIGDHPRSVGYHKRDGVLKLNGQAIDYTTAVDLGVGDLDRKGINRFLNALTAQGFANWYREGPRWKGGEHIHAIYAPLPMKSQLRRQVRQFLGARRAKKIKPLAWEKKFLRGR